MGQASTKCPMARINGRFRKQIGSGDCPLHTAKIGWDILTHLHVVYLCHALPAQERTS